MNLGVIRKKCIDCSAGSAHEVKLCTAHDCPLWGYRMNQTPERLERKRPWLARPEAHEVYVKLINSKERRLDGEDMDDQIREARMDLVALCPEFAERSSE